jgi:3',5'-cyclic AMP phosphodiesterase CpdA
MRSTTEGCRSSRVPQPSVAGPRLPVCRLILLAALLFVAPTLHAQTGAFLFIQLSDTQFGMYTGDREFAQETANFEFAVATINRLRPAFVVITGDLVNKPEDRPQIDEYARIKARIASGIPVYDMPGNHDVENAPTPESLAAYRARARDRYVFSHGSFTGIVLNSSLIHTPDKAQAEASAQIEWLRGALDGARDAGARRIVVFQHHPWFLKSADEPDDYFNIPLARRTALLDLFRRAGVQMLVSGHYHRNAGAVADGLESVVTGPVGMPLGGAKSGLRLFLVTDQAVAHKYYELGELPNAVDVAAGRLP